MEKRISSGAPWEEEAGYSRAIRKGPHIWVSGTTAMKDGELLGKGDAYSQAIRCLEIIEEAIQAAGGRLSDVVRTRMFLTDIAHWEAVSRAHGQFFQEIRPAATLVAIDSLIDPEMLVEIEAEAFLLDHYLLSSQG